MLKRPATVKEEPPATLHGIDFARKLARMLTAEDAKDADGWTYTAVVVGRKAYLRITDEKGEYVGTL